MNGSAPDAAALLASPPSPAFVWPFRMAATSRLLLAGSTCAGCELTAAPGVLVPSADCGVTLPLSAGVGSAGAAARGTIAVSEAAEATGGAERTGCLPARAAFGSQVLLRSTSAASCSGVCCWPLFIRGTGVLVTYSATASATARPSSRPTIRPRAKPPRWFFKEGFTTGFRVQEAAGVGSCATGSSRCIAVGALIPRVVSAFFSTCAVADSSAMRASANGASSTRKCSAA